jgi:hypothetical protein
MQELDRGGGRFGKRRLLSTTSLGHRQDQPWPYPGAARKHSMADRRREQRRPAVCLGAANSRFKRPLDSLSNVQGGLHIKSGLSTFLASLCCPIHWTHGTTKEGLVN